MTTKTGSNIYYILGLLFAIWFALTAWCWVYYVNLIISLPFGLLSLLFYVQGKKVDANPRRLKKIVIILGVGCVISLICVVVLLANN